MAKLTALEEYVHEVHFDNELNIDDFSDTESMRATIAGNSIDHITEDSDQESGRKSLRTFRAKMRNPAEYDDPTKIENLRAIQSIRVNPHANTGWQKQSIKEMNVWKYKGSPWREDIEVVKAEYRFDPRIKLLDILKTCNFLSKREKWDKAIAKLSPV